MDINTFAVDQSLPSIGDPREDNFVMNIQEEELKHIENFLDNKNIKDPENPFIKSLQSTGGPVTITAADSRQEQRPRSVIMPPDLF